MHYLNTVDFIQTTIIQFLRHCFATDERFIYSEDKAKRTLEIKREFPLKVTTYPIVVITSPSIDSYPRTYGNEVFETIREINPYTGNVGVSCYISSGIVEPDLTIHCWANTTKEREILTDKVLWYLRKGQRAYLENQGVGIAGMSKTGVNMQIYGQKLLYTSDINLNLFTQYTMYEYTNWQDDTIDSVIVKPIAYIGNTIILDGF
jgi:hypothetical protein